MHGDAGHTHKRVKRALVAHRGGTGGLAFSGHMDTVPDTGWTTDPWDGRIEGGRLHGLELKSRAGRLSDAQVAYRDALLAAGGDYVVARTLDDVAFALAGWGVPLRCRLLPFLAADAVRAERRRRAA